jgi:hypothetical protein
MITTARRDAAAAEEAEAVDMTIIVITPIVAMIMAVGAMSRVEVEEVGVMMITVAAAVAGGVDVAVDPVSRQIVSRRKQKASIRNMP